MVLFNYPIGLANSSSRGILGSYFNKSDCLANCFNLLSNLSDNIALNYITTMM